MAKLTPGFKLYLYQLLSRQMGFGKQTLLPQVEELLAADDIIPADLECTSVLELAEACPDFLKVTVFKKGRVYATLLRNEEWDQMLATPEEKPAGKGKAAGGHKSWKSKRAAKKTFKPVKPGKQRRARKAAEAQAEAARLAAEEQLRAAEARAAAEAAKAKDEGTLPTEAATSADAPAAETPQTSDALATTREGSGQEQPARSDARTLAETTREAREQEAGDQAHPTPQQETPHEAREAETPMRQAEPAASKAPAAPEPSPISLTITYDPYEDMERELARQSREEAPVPEPAPQPAPTLAPEQPAAPAAHAIPLSVLPQDFAAEVSCKDALLRVLYQLLPFDVEPMAVLDEDWRVARSTGSLSGSRTRVSFPLRYQHQDGTPIGITLRKTAKSVSGKAWSLALVDGDDGTGASHEAVGFEGLPAADEGAWKDLSDMPDSLAPNPVRELAQQVVVGTWDGFLGALATMAAPERWNYPGEGVGRASRYGILREYVASTFHRARCQDRIAHSSDGSMAAFNTGLSTPFGDDVYCCLGARKGDIPWQFIGFATAGSGELGARLAGSISPLPEQPTYLTSLESVTPDHDRMVILDLESILSRQLRRLPRSFLLERLEDDPGARAILSQEGALSNEQLTHLARAIKSNAGVYRRLRRALDDAVAQSLRSCRASYRLAAPVYDPTENRTKLLVPLCLVENARADCALLLDLQPSGAYRAATLLSLPRAYACARVVSREQPAWLAAESVL